MRNTPLLASILLLVVPCCAACLAVPASADVAPLFGSQVELPGLSRFAGLPQDSTVTVWVYFTDKGPRLDVEREVRAVEQRFSPRAMMRRAKVRSGPLVDWRDLPVCPEYLGRLAAMGLEVRARSKWINAASVKCRAGELYRLYELPFVKRVDPVASFPRKEEKFEEVSMRPAAPGLEVVSGAQSPAPGDTAFYGMTWGQLNLTQVPQLHAEGYTGSGIFIGVLDTGFDLTHEALQHVHVVAQWDFINWDSVTANQPGQDAYNQYYHGTYIIGLLAGYKPGTYSGAAFDADYALAKTEYVPTETPIEEDYWVMGIEWLDSLGVDLVSSSLGYIDWYTYADMNGHTAVTTLAASVAVANGVSLFNAMGNGGITTYPYLIAPADGDSVMSIGGVDSLGVLWPQSSRGPTYDGRIKPEVVAQAKVPVCVSPVLPSGYVRVSGTSCATPLAAGACALVLQKNPTWLPMMLREAVRATATNSASPDTAIGWGIVQAANASGYEIVSVAERPPGATRTGVASMAIESEPNPFNPLTTIHVRIFAASGAGLPSSVSAKVFDVSGRCVKDFGVVRVADGTATIIWDGRDDSGKASASGVYVFAARAADALGTKKLLLLR